MTLAELFIPAAFASIFGLIYLAAKMQRESSRFVSELQFYLKHRTIGHNQVKAKLAVLQTKYDKLLQEYEALQVSSPKTTEEANFGGLLQQTEFVESQNSKIEKLELEISSIQEALTGNFKEKLSSYLKDVDGISERLERAKEEFQAERNQTSLDQLNTKNLS